MNDGDRLQFAAEMARCSIATQSEISDEEMEVYWDRFKGANLEDFTTAIRRCADDCVRFPSVRDVRDAFPKRHPAPKEPYQPLIEVRETEAERGSDALESFIDNMTDDQLREHVFAPMYKYSTVCTTDEQKNQAINFCIARFRANPNGRMYRSVIRDEVWKLREILLPDVNEVKF